MSFWASSFNPRVAFGLRIDSHQVDVGRVNPLQSTFRSTRRIKLGHAKHCAKETVFESTVQSTASFFILASCLPPTTPFRSRTYCFGVVGLFSGTVTCTTYWA